ncbi:MAG TPA: ATP-binding protein, partial [Rhodocyclaceae bacterium]|nr:ATP-binding protein [Rhodocyclaceae bacterium]
PGAECRLEFAAGAAPTIVSEPTLEQAVINLLNNAARVVRQEIVVSATWDNSHWTLEIRDDGPGFPPEILTSAGRQAFPAHADGSGIGILLSMAAIERLGGQMHLTNPADGGAIARLRFPIHD